MSIATVTLHIATSIDMMRMLGYMKIFSLDLMDDECVMLKIILISSHVYVYSVDLLQLYENK